SVLPDSAATALATSDQSRPALAKVFAVPATSCGCGAARAAAACGSAYRCGGTDDFWYRCTSWATVSDGAASVASSTSASVDSHLGGVSSSLVKSLGLGARDGIWIWMSRRSPQATGKSGSPAVGSVCHDRIARTTGNCGSSHRLRGGS